MGNERGCGAKQLGDNVEWREGGAGRIAAHMYARSNVPT